MPCKINLLIVRITLNDLRRVGEVMEQFKNIIIGFGKAGKTLAKYLAQHGEDVLLIEKSKQMYGGTCINVGCLPSKNLIINGQRGLDFETAVTKRGEMTGQLRNKNYHMVADEPLATVWDGTARFIGNHELAVMMTDGTTKTVQGERIFINTGATPNWPTVPGLNSSPRIFTSKEAMELSTQPKRLAIIGGGYIGLEFAGMFNSFNTKVTVFDHHDQLLKREDEDIASEVTNDLANAGIHFELNAQLTKASDNCKQVTLFYQQGNQEKTVEFDAVLVAAGRRPNTNQLGLENTEIALTDRGAIQVDDHLQTTVPNVWALGDVNGGPMFTYVSLDDFRIVRDQLFGNGERSTADRLAMPTTSFLNPPLANVGLNERQAKDAGYDPLVFKLSVKAIPKARVLEDQRGIYKVIVDQKTHQILGATLYAAEAHETINLIALAMKAKLPYETLREMIYTHPTMSEALNDLFKAPIKE